MAEPKRQYESEVAIAPALQLQPIPQKSAKLTDEELSSQGERERTNQVDLILGIIERIRKL
jgi:hypothetical protein